MPLKIKDETGRIYGRLTVLGPHPERVRGCVAWVCRCECGNLTVVSGSSLRSGNTKSCGCMRRDEANSRQLPPNKPKLKYSPVTFPELRKPYQVFLSARRRCNNPKNADFSRYGGRGIKFLFDSFDHFWEVMGGAYAPGLTLERIDNDGPYSPENCKWVTRLEQGQNTSKTRKIEFEGTTRSVSEWARELGINRKTLEERLEKWPLERALTEGARVPETFTFEGETKTIQEWANQVGISSKAMRSRLQSWTPEKAIRTPPNENMRRKRTKR